MPRTQGGGTPLKTPEQMRAHLLANRTVTEDGCWLWNRSLHDRGYGQVGWGPRLHFVHRLAADLWEVPGEGPMVLHTCDVRRCFNPDHLYRGTGKQNAADREARNAWCLRRRGAVA